MLKSRLSFLLVFAFFCAGAATTFAQTATPTPVEDKPERISTQEIKVNIAAFDEEGNFAESLKKEDLVISEDGRLHQASYIRHIPANVLILLDTGGENRQAKNIKTTRNAAASLVNALQADDKIALMQYHDKVELLTDWTSDKANLNLVLNKKMSFGKRSVFTDAITEATNFLRKMNVENRHLVLITDGLDSGGDGERKISAILNIIAENINVHIFSYTALEKEVVAKREKSLRGGGRQSKELPPGAGVPIQGQTKTYPIATINLDKEMMRKNRERGEELDRSEKDLIRLAADTNGILYLPESNEELVEKTANLAKNIDSQYVITYIPKRPLDEAPDGEERTIEVTSRREGVFVQARRKLRVIKDK